METFAGFGSFGVFLAIHFEEKKRARFEFSLASLKETFLSLVDGYGDDRAQERGGAGVRHQKKGACEQNLLSATFKEKEKKNILLSPPFSWNYVSFPNL